LNGNDFDEDLFLDLLLDQFLTKWKQKLKKKSLLLNEVISQLAYYINLIYKSRWTLMLQEGFWGGLLWSIVCIGMEKIAL
jgi:hypothetical protein